MPALIFDNIVAAIFRRHPALLESRLHRISITEYDSAWQALQAYYGCNDDRLKSVFFELYLEEWHHGELFANLTSKKDSPTLAGRSEFFHKLSNIKEIRDFIEFECRGEAAAIRAHKTFLRRTADFPKVCEVFTRVHADEQTHVQRLKAALGNFDFVDTARRPIRHNPTKFLGGNFLRFLAGVNRVVTEAILILFFYLFGALYALRKKSR